RDRHVSDCGYALQLWLSSQPGLDSITTAAPLGDRSSLVGITRVCRIDYRFWHLVAACGSSQSRLAHRLAKSIHDLDVCFMADSHRLVSCISQEGIARLQGLMDIMVPNASRNRTGSLGSLGA